MSRARDLHVSYAEQLRLIPSRWAGAGFLALAVAWLAAPLVLSEFQLDVGARVAIFALGAIGLNLLTGFTGQVSLGHAFFIGTGAYAAAWAGGDQEWPLWLWLPGITLLGVVLGAVIGPFALRLRGNYLAIVTLGLLFIGEHLFNNWDSVTGGGAGRSVEAETTIAGMSGKRLAKIDSSEKPFMPGNIRSMIARSTSSPRSSSASASSALPASMHSMPASTWATRWAMASRTSAWSSMIRILVIALQSYPLSIR